jgi:hypothetical protein
MERVLGIGGHFMRAADPVALGARYREVTDPEGNAGSGRVERVITVEDV